MSAASNLHSEDQFLCSICLEVFTAPVTTPCGHNFCKHCITEHWNSKVVCDCPLCKDCFYKRPELKVNTLLSDVVAQFRDEADVKDGGGGDSQQQAAKPGEVPCDVCIGTKTKAVKSCLVCLVSYCQAHLEPHLTAPALKRHQLTAPVEDLEARMCPKHQKPLELFCTDEQTAVCMMCTVLEHRTHRVVPLSEGCDGKKAELRTTEAETQRMIRRRREKIKEIRESVERSKAAAAGVKEEGFEVFAALAGRVETALQQLMERMDEEEAARERRAGALVGDLEEEIGELTKRSSELQRLLHTEDHLHLLRGFSSLKAAPPTRDWTEVHVRPASYGGTVAEAVAWLEEDLGGEMRTLVRKMSEAELKAKRQFAVDVTLDPDTANPELLLSDDGRQVSHGDVRRKLPDNPERFSLCVDVLGKQSFSSGRFYFQVQVKGKTGWDLGVARASVKRKGGITLSPDEGFWTIWLRDGDRYAARENRIKSLSLRRAPEKVGVFVDYEEGLVSFYDVDAAALVYSFTDCCFADKLLPYFSPYLNEGGKNSAPLVICPVRD